MPDKEFLTRLLLCFGVEYFGHDISFTKEHLIKINTIVKVINLVDELTTFYIPCKARLYLHDLTVQKCITILRQILKLHSCYIMSIQKMKFGVKSVYYTIMWPETGSFLKKEGPPYVVTFN